MEHRLPGTGTCDWCGEETSMPALVCVVADPHVRDCLCDACSAEVDALKRRLVAARLAGEMGRPEPQGGLDEEDLGST